MNPHVICFLSAIHPSLNIGANMLKSDDVAGRVKTYEAIVKGENAKPPGASHGPSLQLDCAGEYARIIGAVSSAGNASPRRGVG